MSDCVFWIFFEIFFFFKVSINRVVLLEETENESQILTDILLHHSSILYLWHIEWNKSVTLEITHIVIIFYAQSIIIEVETEKSTTYRMACWFSLTFIVLSSEFM